MTARSSADITGLLIDHSSPIDLDQIVLRFFGGLRVAETAEILQVSGQTVMRDWRLARAWIARELGAD